jgi:hypothetical protein
MEEFEWLAETNDVVESASEALFELKIGGVKEKGIAIIIKNKGVLALTVSELQRIIDEINNK